MNILKKLKTKYEKWAYNNWGKRYQFELLSILYWGDVFEDYNALIIGKLRKLIKVLK